MAIWSALIEDMYTLSVRTSFMTRPKLLLHPFNLEAITIMEDGFIRLSVPQSTDAYLKKEI